MPILGYCGTMSCQGGDGPVCLWPCGREHPDDAKDGVRAEPERVWMFGQTERLRYGTTFTGLPPRCRSARAAVGAIWGCCGGYCGDCCGGDMGAAVRAAVGAAVRAAVGLLCGLLWGLL